MTEEELKNKCKERAKIFQQAMESCKSSSLIDCIEWFADRIAELEKENAELKSNFSICEKNADTYYDKLQKAKELLKEFVQHYKAKTIYVGNMQDLLEQSEQFLNSEVEK